MIKPFESIEQAIQWCVNVCSYKALGGRGKAHHPFRRACSANDIVVIAKMLLDNKKITPGQHLIFRRLIEGAIEYVPYSLLPKWNDFVNKMEIELNKRGFINKELHYV